MAGAAVYVSAALASRVVTEWTGVPVDAGEVSAKAGRPGSAALPGAPYLVDVAQLEKVEPRRRILGRSSLVDVPWMPPDPVDDRVTGEAAVSERADRETDIPLAGSRLP